jgi:hypothetical protein
MGFMVDKLALRKGFLIFPYCHHLKLKKIKFTLEQAMRAERGSRSMAVLFFNLGAIWG